VTDRPFDDLTEKIQELDRARRELAQALDASRIGAVEGDRWPRTVNRERRIDRRPFLLCVAAIVLAAAFMTRQWMATPEAAPPSSASITLAPMAATPVATASSSTQAATAPAPTPLVVHIRVVRACSVRIVVDDVPLEWRRVSPGDEMISRPARDVIIETDDGGALVVSVNGVTTSLGTDGTPATRRFLR
jgi:hypothetical protein